MSLSSRSYYRSLASWLRGRRIPEGRLTEILREVRDAEASSGQPAKEIFGTAMEYAENFDKGRATSTGRAVMHLGGVLALGWLLLALVLVPEWRLWQIFLIALAVIAVGVLLGELLNRRLPTEVELPQR